MCTCHDFFFVFPHSYYNGSEKHELVVGLFCSFSFCETNAETSFFLFLETKRGLPKYLFSELHKYLFYSFLLVGNKKVQALELEFPIEERPHHFTNEEFMELRNLRCLQVDYADLDGDFTSIFFFKLKMALVVRMPKKI